jgi:hypothetical protein
MKNKEGITSFLHLVPLVYILWGAFWWWFANTGTFINILRNLLKSIKLQFEVIGKNKIKYFFSQFKKTIIKTILYVKI